MQANIIRTHTLHGISSASGIEAAEGKFYIAGDDSPWLFELGHSFKIQHKIPLEDPSLLKNGRIPKDLKPDYEAITFLKWGDETDLFLFGSGTLAPRNKLARINLSNSKVSYYELDTFYKLLQEKANIKPGDFNIEGAASWKENLILLNRGTNSLFIVHRDELEKFIADGSAVNVDFYSFKLPEFKGHPARFSGACILEGTDELLFCASIEDTPNWYSDGEVLGSYIGIIDLGKPSHNTPICVPVMHERKPYTGKIESVACISTNERAFNVLAVTDNDDGTSALLEVKVTR